jgi:nuclear transport factor 2 (NTF2) superfamily protein
VEVGDIIALIEYSVGNALVHPRRDYFRLLQITRIVTRRIRIDDAANWFRSYGNENWEFAADGLMQRRLASINDLPIQEAERKFRWDRSGPRPPDHKGLSDLAL